VRGVVPTSDSLHKGGLARARRCSAPRGPGSGPAGCGSTNRTQDGKWPARGQAHPGKGRCEACHPTALSTGTAEPRAGISALPQGRWTANPGQARQQVRPLEPAPRDRRARWCSVQPRPRSSRSAGKKHAAGVRRRATSRSRQAVRPRLDFGCHPVAGDTQGAATHRLRALPLDPGLATWAPPSTTSATSRDRARTISAVARAAHPRREAARLRANLLHLVPQAGWTSTGQHGLVGRAAASDTPQARVRTGAGSIQRHGGCNLMGLARHAAVRHLFLFFDLPQGRQLTGAVSPSASVPRGDAFARQAPGTTGNAGRVCGACHNTSAGSRPRQARTGNDMGQVIRFGPPAWLPRPVSRRGPGERRRHAIARRPKRPAR